MGTEKPIEFWNGLQDQGEKKCCFGMRSSSIRPISFKTTAYTSENSLITCYFLHHQCSQDHGHSRSLESKRCSLLTFQVLVLFCPLY